MSNPRAVEDPAALEALLAPVLAELLALRVRHRDWAREDYLADVAQRLRTRLDLARAGVPWDAGDEP